MQFGRKSEQLQRQIETLETQLEDLAAGRGVADVQRAQALGANASTSSDDGRSGFEGKRFPRICRARITCSSRESSCPDCGQPMQALGEDVSEQLARVAAAFKVIRTIRRKMVCPCCSTITQPPMPGLPIERSIAHPSLLADILVSKYADHQPLVPAIGDRGTRRRRRSIRASTGRWVGQCEALCEPLTEALRRYTMAASKLHADDTPIPVLAPGNRKTKTGRLWVYVRDDRRSGSTEPASVWFAYSPNRQGIHPQTHLAGFKGILQADAFAGFDELFPMVPFARLHARTTPGESSTTSMSARRRRQRRRRSTLSASSTASKPPFAEDQQTNGCACDSRKASLCCVPIETWLKATLANAVEEVGYGQGDQLLAQPVERTYALLRRRPVEIGNNIAENALRCVALGSK